MTELDVLRVLCWIAVFVGAAAIAFTVIPMVSANGTRPLLLAFSTMAIATFIGSVFLLLITYDIDRINSTGWAEVGVFYLRIKPTIVGLLLIWVGRRYWQAREH